MKRFSRDLVSLLALTVMAAAGGLAVSAPAASASTASVTELQEQAFAGQFIPAQGRQLFYEFAPGVNWVVPTVAAGNGKEAAASAVLRYDGVNGAPGEEVGVEVRWDASKGKAEYRPFVQVQPASPVYLPLAVAPGDHLGASVSIGSGTVTLTISDTTTNASAVRTVAAPTPQSFSVGVGAVRGASGSYLPLANFSRASFTDAYLGWAMGSWAPSRVTMVAAGVTKATSNLFHSNGVDYTSFAVAWNHS